MSLFNIWLATGVEGNVFLLHGESLGNPRGPRAASRLHDKATEKDIQAFPPHQGTAATVCGYRGEFHKFRLDVTLDVTSIRRAREHSTSASHTLFPGASDELDC